jgi:hypothetical protein
VDVGQGSRFTQTNRIGTQVLGGMALPEMKILIVDVANTEKQIVQRTAAKVVVLIHHGSLDGKTALP